MNQKIKLDKGDQQLQDAGDAIIGFVKGIIRGTKKLISDPIKLAIFTVITLICGVIFYFRKDIFPMIVPDAGEGFHIVKILLSLILIVPFLFIYLIGEEEKSEQDEFEKKFAEIKFCGKGGTYPKFVSKEEDGKKVIYSFYSPGLNILEWRKRQVEIETALNCNILRVETAKNTNQIIKLHTVPASEGIKENLPWSNEYIKEKDFILAVGEGILDEVTFDLNKYPHALIAGVTGSGKSVILRCMLWQCIKKGAKIYMIDFKGGVEFGKQYEAFGEVITDRKSALELTKELVKEMKLRLEVFRKYGVKNITEYNEMFPDKPLARIVLVCDEIAEMLDKTGLAKADAAIFYEIEKELSSIARLARAPGINMILATQRPDAKVLVGQIKNNLPIRISGRMVDTVASEMVLGNNKASTLGDTLGRFMYTIGSDTYEFQAYNFKDDILENGNYQIGGMLMEGYSGECELIDEEDEEEYYDDYLDISSEDDYDEYEGF